jgi:hypothetical protein
MNEAYKIAYQNLYAVYNKYRKKYRNNPDSKQMCCMWSTNNPPDILEVTQQIYDIEKAFGIKIDEDEAIKMYDMNLNEATEMILKIKLAPRRC